ncbi:MAG: Sua5/YciO/YrdC/YwlC family protein [Candidatus Coatesbacteria bacterium]|nr:Sua5/YciO/YrdC/YwlC family protein [Candidatus Coatesbacteria bacterium]
MITEDKIAIRNALLKGEIVCLPTDTFYSLSVIYDNLISLTNLSDLKKTENPILLLLPSIAHLELVSFEVNNLWLGWLEMVWPSAITFIVPARKLLYPVITRGTEKVGVRVPQNPDLLDLLLELDKPVTGTSANPINLDPARNPQEAEKYFPDLKIWKLNNFNESKKPSTIIDLTTEKPTLLRQGIVEITDLPPFPLVPFNEY